MTVKLSFIMTDVNNNEIQVVHTVLNAKSSGQTSKWWEYITNLYTNAGTIDQWTISELQGVTYSNTAINNTITETRFNIMWTLEAMEGVNIPTPAMMSLETNNISYSTLAIVNGREGYYTRTGSNYNRNCNYKNISTVQTLSYNFSM